MADKKPEKPQGKKTDKLIGALYKDHDTYDWAGRKTDSGVDVRRKGSDR